MKKKFIFILLYESNKYRKKDKQFISLKICSCEKLRTADRLNEKGRWPPLWDPTWRPFTYTAPV